jgi:hypothetical protein
MAMGSLCGCPVETKGRKGGSGEEGGCLAFYQLKKEGGHRACGVGAPAGSGALPVEVDGAEWRGAGEEGGFQSGGPRLGCCSGPGRRNGEVFDLFKLTSNGIDLI